MDCSDSDQRLEHMRDPAEFVTLEEIEKRTGVLYWHVSYSVISPLSHRVAMHPMSFGHGVK